MTIRRNLANTIDKDATNVKWQDLVDLFFDKNDKARAIVLTHSAAVKDLALSINKEKKLCLDPAKIEIGAMLHDVGIIKTDAPSIGCFGKEPYIRHGIIGADMLRQAGAPEWVARVAERHTGAGLTPNDIVRQNLPLPADRVLFPQTQLERLICYADKFFSKKPNYLTEKKSFEKIRAEMSAHGPESLKRFQALEEEFGL